MQLEQLLINQPALGWDVENRVDILNRFVLLYNSYITVPRDYGTGSAVSTVEAHILANIDNHPGITVTELARKWQRTKGAISQTVSKLESKGYVCRERKATDAKVFHLYTTDAGKALCHAHLLYDKEHIAQTLALLSGDGCTPEDFDAFYRVLSSFTRHLSLRAAKGE